MNGTILLQRIQINGNSGPQTITPPVNKRFVITKCYVVITGNPISTPTLQIYDAQTSYLSITLDGNPGMFIFDANIGIMQTLKDLPLSINAQMGSGSLVDINLYGFSLYGV